MLIPACVTLTFSLFSRGVRLYQYEIERLVGDFTIAQAA